MPVLIAKIAVSAATYWIDRPYDYLVPEEFGDRVQPGMRVSVPFSRGNRQTEGVVLAMADGSKYETLKPILAVLDDKPVLTEEQLRLALFMRERFFCTVYDAVKAILPAGLWFQADGSRRVRDKTVEMARLAVAAEDAADGSICDDIDDGEMQASDASAAEQEAEESGGTNRSILAEILN